MSLSGVLCYPGGSEEDAVLRAAQWLLYELQVAGLLTFREMRTGLGVHLSPDVPVAAQRETSTAARVVCASVLFLFYV